MHEDEVKIRTSWFNALVRHLKEANNGDWGPALLHSSFDTFINPAAPSLHVLTEGLRLLGQVGQQSVAHAYIAESSEHSLGHQVRLRVREKSVREPIVYPHVIGLGIAKIVVDRLIESAVNPADNKNGDVLDPDVVRHFDRGFADRVMVRHMEDRKKAASTQLLETELSQMQRERSCVSPEIERLKRTIADRDREIQDWARMKRELEVEKKKLGERVRELEGQLAATRQNAEDVAWPTDHTRMINDGLVSMTTPIATVGIDYHAEVKQMQADQQSQANAQAELQSKMDAAAKNTKCQWAGDSTKVSLGMGVELAFGPQVLRLLKLVQERYLTKTPGASGVFVTRDDVRADVVARFGAGKTAGIQDVAEIVNDVVNPLAAALRRVVAEPNDFANWAGVLAGPVAKLLNLVSLFADPVPQPVSEYAEAPQAVRRPVDAAVARLKEMQQQGRISPKCEITVTGLAPNESRPLLSYDVTPADKSAATPDKKA